MIRKPIRRRIVAAVTGVVLSAGALSATASGASATSEWPVVEDAIAVEVVVDETEIVVDSKVSVFDRPIYTLRGIVRW